MAPLPQNLTDRWFLDYITGNEATSTEHTMMIRGNAELGIDGATQTFYEILNGIGPSHFWPGWRGVRLRHSTAGSDFSFPTGMGTALSAFVGTGSLTYYNEACEAIEHTVQGRSPTSGRRGDLSIYGIRASYLEKFRYTASDGAPYSGLIEAISSLIVPLQCIDGSALYMYPYVNANYNSYWESRSRTK